MGLAMAALIDWILTVARANSNAATAAITNDAFPPGERYGYKAGNDHQP